MAWRPVCGECGRLGDPGTRAEADALAWKHEVRHWTEESCRASGVPLHVQDPIALRKIAILLGIGVSAGPVAPGASGLTP